MTQHMGTTGSQRQGRQRAFASASVVAALLLFAGGWSPLALAIDPPPPAKTPAATAKPAAEKPVADKPAEEKPAADKPAADKTAAEAAKPVVEDDEKLPPPPKTPGKSAGSPQRFEPSEQVRPDFDVSFPIDI